MRVDILIVSMIDLMRPNKRRAVSPVIATVIIVAVSYWISGISSQYTSFEKVEIKSAYASRKVIDPGNDETFKGWVIKIGVQNTGSQTSTLESLYVNNKPLDEYGFYDTNKPMIKWTETAPVPSAIPVPGDDAWLKWEGLTGVSSVSMESGDSTTIYILIYGFKAAIPDPVTDGIFSAGTTLNIQFHSANGMDYIKLVQLT